MVDDYISHFGRSKRDGAPVGSGRYPLGSGKNPQSLRNKLTSKALQKMEKEARADFVKANSSKEARDVNDKGYAFLGSATNYMITANSTMDAAMTNKDARNDICWSIMNRISDEGYDGSFAYEDDFYNYKERGIEDWLNGKWGITDSNEKSSKAYKDFSKTRDIFYEASEKTKEKRANDLSKEVLGKGEKFTKSILQYADDTTPAIEQALEGKLDTYFYLDPVRFTDLSDSITYDDYAQYVNDYMDRAYGKE